MDTIVFYVHRTGLLNYFLSPICDYLSKDYKITVLHLDKKNGYHSDEFETFNKVDISDFSITQIKNLLADISPKAVITLGFVSIYELLILRIAKSMGFRLIYLEHGIYSKDTVSLPYSKILISFKTTLFKNIFFIKKYLAFALQSKSTMREINTLYRLLFKKEYRKLGFDKAIFFSEHGCQNINKLFNLNESNVLFSNYPLVNSNAEYEEYKKISLTNNQKNKKAIYIHQPFIKDKLVDWKYDDEKSFILNIEEETRNINLGLDLLIHPREDFKFYDDLYKDTSINILQNIEKKDYANYELAIGHYSTALLYPIFFRIPLWIVNYGNNILQSTSVFKEINSYHCKNTTNYDEFIRSFVGIGKCSFENVSDTVKSAIKN